MAGPTRPGDQLWSSVGDQFGAYGIRRTRFYTERFDREQSGPGFFPTRRPLVSEQQPAGDRPASGYCLVSIWNAKDGDPRRMGNFFRSAVLVPGNRRFGQGSGTHAAVQLSSGRNDHAGMPERAGRPHRAGISQSTGAADHAAGFVSHAAAAIVEQRTGVDDVRSEPEIPYGS